MYPPGPDTAPNETFASIWEKYGWEEPSETEQKKQGVLGWAPSDPLDDWTEEERKGAEGGQEESNEQRDEKRRGTN